MTTLYPLLMQPLLKRYLWGGRRLGEVLGKPIGEGSDYAESWEVADHAQGQSTVANGPLTGTTLGQLMRDSGRELTGLDPAPPRFPLMFKFLDSQRDLSVQVHPSDEQAAKLDPPDLGKTEAWLILDAKPGALVYAGLKRGVDRALLERELARGTVPLCMHQFSPAVGDCLFIPAGTVHALGEGLLVAEIQQASDTTYRLYDWNRVGADGKPRQLHVEESLAVTDFDLGPVKPVEPEKLAAPGSERLVRCDKFFFDRHAIVVPLVMRMSGRFRIVSVVDGSVDVPQAHLDRPLRKGDTLVIPAAVETVEFRPHGSATLIEMGLPD